MAPNPNFQRSVNRWAAKIIPIVLTGLVGYTTWVEISTLVVQYLFSPPSGVRVRAGAGITITVLYFLLLAILALSYFRTLQVVITNPGYVSFPEATQLSGNPSSSRHRPRHQDAHTEKIQDLTAGSGDERDGKGFLNRGDISNGRTVPPPGLEFFYLRDVFECEIDGLPRWCARCNAWKPDRSHHCSEIDRCVYKMDHYCPWAGGVITEASFKFFVQFCCYGAAYWLFNLIVLAYFTTVRHQERTEYDPNWVLTLALSALFFIFSGGIGGNSINFACLNTTTIDNLSRGRVYHLAILITPHSTPSPRAPLLAEPRLSPQSAAPRRNDKSEHVATPPSPVAPSTPHPYPTITYPLAISGLSQQNTTPRTFAILPTSPGTNPYRLSSASQNFKQVMGEHWWDWFLPIRSSPSWTWRRQHQHQDMESGGAGAIMYPFGPSIERMKKVAGLLPSPANEVQGSEAVGRHGKRRRRRYTDSVARTQPQSAAVDETRGGEHKSGRDEKGKPRWKNRAVRERARSVG